MSGTLQTVPGYSLQPSATKKALASNYINDFDFMNQYLPDIREKEFERYGNRSINSFLREMGAELPSASDLIKWEEQGRLHTKYVNISIVYGGANDTAVCTVNDAGITACNFRVGQTVFLSSTTNNTSDKAIITAVSGLTFNVAYYAAAGGTINAADTIQAFVYGSEFKKGTNGMQESLEADPDIFEVSPIIIKDKYGVNGSDMTQIGWVDISTEDGASGFLWYLKSEHETRLRYDDYLEMSMLEAVPAETGSGAIAAGGDVGNKGTEGMFYVIENRGNVWSGGNPSTLGEFDTMIKRLDKQGAIEENALFVGRDFDLDIDDMLAAQNSYGLNGTSYGLFNNDEQMALSLGFKGFKRAGYNFYKTSWKYLNDPTLRGGVTGGSINGALVPAGTMTVYDKVLGKNATRPFLHVRYRETAQENRRYKTWITGSAGGATNSEKDAMEVHFLSERALCTLGANNFFLFKS